MIKSCLDSDPGKRPSFRELLDRFRDVQKRYSLQAQMQQSLRMLCWNVVLRRWALKIAGPNSKWKWLLLLLEIKSSKQDGSWTVKLANLEGTTCLPRLLPGGAVAEVKLQQRKLQSETWMRWDWQWLKSTVGPWTCPEVSFRSMYLENQLSRSLNLCNGSFRSKTRLAKLFCPAWTPPWPTGGKGGKSPAMFLVVLQARGHIALSSLPPSPFPLFPQPHSLFSTTPWLLPLRQP